MGNCSFKPDGDGLLENNDDTISLSKHNFTFLYVIGRGGFGKVWRVQCRKNMQLYAMKEMSKARILLKRSVQSVINERRLLEKLKHPFLVNMNFAFQDRENLYLVSDLLTGGDLRYHIGKRRRFSEPETKFMLACLICGLEYMHTEGVIHRDIKPENLVMEASGYIRITDMGIAKIWQTENSQDTSGTPGYMAPEVMCRQNHTYAVDYFAVGVIGYEFMLGRRPYVGKTRKDIRDMMFAKQVYIKKSDIWLRDWNWQKLLEKKLEAPYKPHQTNDNFDKAQANNMEHWKKDEESQEMKQHQLKLLDPAVQKNFQGYSYEPKGMGQLIIPPTVTKKGAPKSAQAQSRRTKSVNITGSEMGGMQAPIRPIPNPNAINLNQEQQAQDVISTQNKSLMGASIGSVAVKPELATAAVNQSNSILNIPSDALSNFSSVQPQRQQQQQQMMQQYRTVDPSADASAELAAPQQQQQQEQEAQPQAHHQKSNSLIPSRLLRRQQGATNSLVTASMAGSVQPPAQAQKKQTIPMSFLSKTNKFLFGKQQQQQQASSDQQQQS